MARPKKNQPIKSDFIRQFPSLPAAEVVKKAKEAGITVSTNLVYMVRTRAEEAAKRRQGASKVAPSQPNKARPSKAPAASPVAAKVPTVRVGGPSLAKTSAKAAPSRVAKPASKSAFIRSLPASTPANAVVAAGAKLGLRFTPTYVYNVRGASSNKPAAASAAASARAPSGTSNEVAFRRLVIELGIARSTALLDALAKQLEAIVSG